MFIANINSTLVTFSHGPNGMLRMNVAEQHSREYDCETMLNNPMLPDETRQVILEAIKVMGLKKEHGEINSEGRGT